MKHSTALQMVDRGAIREHDHPDCEGELIPCGGGFWDDVKWTLNRCATCGDVIALVGGGVHWWNYTVTNPAILADCRKKPLEVTTP